MLNATDGKILSTLPTGSGVDAAEFNPQTMEAFSSSGDGKLTVIKETSPTSIAVEQNVTTKPGAKCSTLDSKTGQIYLITAEAQAEDGAERQCRVRFRFWLSENRPFHYHSQDGRCYGTSQIPYGSTSQGLEKGQG